MSRQPHHTPAPQRSRPDLLDDEQAAPTPRKPPPTDDAEAAAELGRAALVEFLAAGGVDHGIGIVASWDHRIGQLELGTRALATAQLAHEEAAQLRDQAARERHQQLLSLVAQQGAAIGTTGAALARASRPDPRELAPPATSGAPSTFPAALRAAVQSKTAAGVLIGFVLALLAFAEQQGWLVP